MGVKYEPFMGGYTPVCNDCGVSLCWDISPNEYDDNTEFWDNWKCQDCNGGLKYSKAYHNECVQKEIH